MNVAIGGLGVAIPDRRLTNADLASMVDTSDGWIVERTGIRERRIAADHESTATLAIEAGASAIKDAGLTPSGVDLLLVATATPEQPIPATASFVQDGIGLSCGAFDVGAACAGFVYALVVGASLLATGGLRSVLVVGAETLSRIVDPNDATTCILFGDAAGAAVLVPSVPGRGLLGWDLGCDGAAAHLLEVRAGGSRVPASAATVAARDHFLRMAGREVFRRAVRAVVTSSSAALQRARVGPADIDWFVPHQANVRIIDAAAERLGIPAGRTIRNIDRYGNTSAASIPVALAEAEPADGDLVLLSGFGAGMTWASAVVRWDS